MLRLFDWVCVGCESRTEGLVDVPSGFSPPKLSEQLCLNCEARTEHERVISLPGPYYGEKTLNPMQSGGDYDTMGEQGHHDLPMLPGALEHGRKLAAAIGEVKDSGDPDNVDALCDAMRSVGGGPSADDYIAHIAKPEFQEISEANVEIDRRNDEKKDRLAALRSGANINFRRDRCVGDPDITA